MDAVELLIVILILLWITGNLSAYTFGGLLHVLLLIAVILLVIRLLRTVA
ncbi:lmo0937 family membrane protein [Candidatus Micrarchaeota archaeon]|nr:lmo0937 family membrane protein [Candidatus Micrarchaeota archaeon]